jgi:KamA family protein
MKGVKYKAFTLKNIQEIPQIRKLPEVEKHAIEVVGRVIPFKTNNYVVNSLIDWNCVPEDPIYVQNFPQAEMLAPEDFDRVARAIRLGLDNEEIERIVNRIRFRLNPHPASQLDENIPYLHGKPLQGAQHKYNETVLFFPSNGQTCHAYCTFCFRWPQFIGDKTLKIASSDTQPVIQYLVKHPEVSDVLITGGDPLVMSTKLLATYLRTFLMADLPSLQTIRIGTKAISNWPYRFLTDPDADQLLILFEEIVDAGFHLAIMAHFSHPREMQTEAVQEAIARILRTGAQIRTQAPLMAHINDRSEIWAEMWSEQVKQGCVPYYMFLPRKTGAQRYFSIPLIRAWEIYQGAYQRVSGLARTVRGPSMSTNVGKVQILGTCMVHGERVFVLQFLQGRRSNWTRRPFLAQYDEDATWFDELKPPFDQDRFFFEMPRQSKVREFSSSS